LINYINPGKTPFVIKLPLAFAEDHTISTFLFHRLVNCLDDFTSLFPISPEQRLFVFYACGKSSTVLPVDLFLKIYPSGRISFYPE
jgi:hypothetical protein